ncbi:MULTISPECIES: alpha/beta fold hydrolase [unclassified Ruegeria]|uniref:alpha/beta fold hydrolase n=1 Tax=unclassified Ruegeria TaxID=2625375 RepID=UPI001ADC018F|nr:MULTISPECIES: alpha/beta fold hydrolase [unclassified Ruegeria]MBO9411069.1 alpha/beta fold hydrolase [Ruegeria sp. R8_1]MBO9415270.1 alpha/beta fold hydrolase [Ruegeria sp. R8_2]
MRVLLTLILFLLPVAAQAKCVVLLHGLARTEASFTVMDQLFKAHGYTVVRPGYPSTDLPIPDLANQTLPDAFAACGEDTVNVVAHSMGGILLRYWLQDNMPENLGRVVMLGPPNQGSQLVDELSAYEVFGMLNGPAGLALGTGPEGLPRMLPPVDFELGVIAGKDTLNPLFSSMIDGPDDGKVSVESTKVAGMKDHIVLPVTHTFMMNNPRVMAQALHFIEFGQFDPQITWLDGVQDIIDEICIGQDCSEPESERSE